MYLFPNRVARSITMNISPSVDRSCSSGLNGSDLEQMSERQRMKTFPECRRHLEYCFDSELVYLKQIKHANTSKLLENHLLIHVSD